MKKIIAVILIAILALGCIGNNGTDDTKEKGGTKEKPPIGEASKDDMLPQQNVPRGLMLFAVVPDMVDVTLGGQTVKAYEAVYRDSEDNDVYVHAIPTESPEKAKELVDTYLKEQQKKPQKTIVFNNHKAVQITFNPVVKGEQVSQYQFIWTNENVIFIVGDGMDRETTLELAEATGY